MQGGLYKFTGGPTLDDHFWHEFIQFTDEPTAPDNRLIWGRASDLLAKFRAVIRWQTPEFCFPIERGLPRQIFSD